MLLAPVAPAVAAPAGDASGPSADAAASAFGHCTAGNFCAYRDYNGGCNIYYYYWNDSTWHNDYSEFGCGPSADRARSAFNNGNQTRTDHYEDVIIWENAGYTGYGACIPRGAKAYSLEYWNNKVSSHQWAYSHCAAGDVFYRSPSAPSSAATLMSADAVRRAGIFLPVAE
jgi:hypothetical protein